MINVLIDAFGVSEKPSGLSNYSIEIIKKFEKFKEFNFTILCNNNLRENHILFSLKQKNILFSKHNVPAIGPKRDIFYYKFLRKNKRFELFHSFSSYLPIFMPIKKKIVTLHDVKYIRNPSFINNFFKYFYLKLCMNNSFKKSTKILAVSNFTKKELIALQVCQRKIEVVYEANTLNNCIGKDTKAKDHFLFVGVNRPHKNIKNMIRAYKLACLKLNNNIPNLIIVGSDTDNLNNFIIQNNIQKKVVLKGHIDDSELLLLYKTCIAFLFPSLYEGFGLPILEAMSFSKPVITSNITATAEISGYAGILVDPYDIYDISKSIVRLCNDKIYYLKYSQLSYKRSKEFSWDKASEEILSIYRKAFN